MSEQAKVKRKQCNECLERKELTAFHVRRASWDGRQDKCKDCQRPIMRANNQKLRDKRKAAAGGK